MAQTATAQLDEFPFNYSSSQFANLFPTPSNTHLLTTTVSVSSPPSVASTPPASYLSSSCHSDRESSPASSHLDTPVHSPVLKPTLLDHLHLNHPHPHPLPHSQGGIIPLENYYNSPKNNNSNILDNNSDNPQHFAAPHELGLSSHQDYPVYSTAPVDLYSTHSPLVLAPPPPPQPQYHLAPSPAPSQISNDSNTTASYQQQQQQQQSSPLQIPMLYHPVPQLAQQQQGSQQQQYIATAAQAQFYQQQATAQQQFYSAAPPPPPSYPPPPPQQQQQQQQQQSPYPFPTPAPTSFETPQGTYYFVPNPSTTTTTTGFAPLPSGMVRHQQNPSISSTTSSSWETALVEGEDKMLLHARLAAAAASLAAAGHHHQQLHSAVVKKGRKPGLGGPTTGKNQLKRFVCPHPDCGRAFARNFNMQSHLKSHLGIRDFDCPHCPKKFSRRHDRARHCAAVHDSHIVESFGEGGRATSSVASLEEDEEVEG